MQRSSRATNITQMVCALLKITKQTAGLPVIKLSNSRHEKLFLEVNYFT
jgi:hypothetical protein